MHRLAKKFPPARWIPAFLVVLALAACAPARTPAPSPIPSAVPTNTALPTETPPAKPSPGPILIPTSTPTPLAPTSTLTPSSTPMVAVTITYIKMIDRTTGWAEGQLGTEEANHILRTTDGGVTWRDVSPVLVDRFGQDAFFLDAQLAWVWNSNLGESWRTLDGGQSWATVSEFGWSPDLGFVDSQHGWKLDAEVWGLSFAQFDIVSFATTQDGGMTWQETNPPPEWGVAYMAYPSAQTAWALRAGFAKTFEGVAYLGVPFRIQTSFDGGATWITREMPLPPEVFVFERPYEGTYLGGVGNCEFVSPVYSSTAIWKVALTCESESWMYTTANQGETWIISPMPAGVYTDIQFISPTVGWLFVLDPLDYYLGDLYQTTNGGQSWTLIKRTGWADIGLSFVDSQLGWAVACTAVHCQQPDAQRALVKTTDGGRSWRLIEPRLAP